MSLAIVAAGFVVASPSGSDDEAVAEQPASPARSTSASIEQSPAEGSVDMAELLEPGVLPDKVLGRANAPVAIVEYASMTCPHCAQFHNVTLPELKTKYIETGKVRLIFREFPSNDLDLACFALARCAGDNYFLMVEVLFRQQVAWATAENARDALQKISKLAGFSRKAFEACLKDEKTVVEVLEVRDRGASMFEVESTPTFFINGRTYKRALPIAEMSTIIDSML